MKATDNRYTNRLESEMSPYLRQHAHNPVDWYPWEEAAFERAKRENKPVFLSVGYSTCHWCHVMAEESFEDLDVAELLNRHFVAVKVDKEERPDIDAVYMEVCQAMTGQGGWPMTIIMTPEQKPFFAGTYFPRKASYGMPGLLDILKTVAAQWDTDRHRLIQTGNEITRILSEYQNQETGRENGTELIKKAAEHFKTAFDGKYGGFGDAPKFPTPHNLLFLLRHSLAQKDKALSDMAEKTLVQMYRGGIFDHVGYGFSRYSTDKKWLVPHFEKMLYDNALLAFVYFEAYQATGRELYKRVGEKIFVYLTEDMQEERGGFFAAQDADSEGEEGSFYVFTPKEIKKTLGERDGEMFCEFYGVTEEGNFEGKNVLNLIQNPRYEEDTNKLQSLRARIKEYRYKRQSLHRDDKLLTSWNFLTAAALAKAYRATGESDYLIRAEKTIGFLMEYASDKNGGLYAAALQQKGRDYGFLTDYAFGALAFLSLYEASFRAVYLQRAVSCVKKMAEYFWDDKEGGFLFYDTRRERLILNPKEYFDGAVPSGNSAAFYALAKLSHMTGDAFLSELCRRQAEFMEKKCSPHPYGSTLAMMAFQLYFGAGRELVMVVEKNEEINELREFLRQHYLPDLTVLVKNPSDSGIIESVAPYLRNYHLVNGKKAYYYCQGHSCESPVTDIAALKRIMGME